ncbi:MAG: hypothetical protein GXY71_09070 [Treponema sp.]|nr:hypothetical protein [Treponema sp.]
MNTSIVTKNLAPPVTTPESATIRNPNQDYILKVNDTQEDQLDQRSKKYEWNARVPNWMTEKVLTLITDRNDVDEARGGIFIELLRDQPRRKIASSLYRLESEATILLQAELVVRPEIAELVPNDFVETLKVSTSGSNLTPIERSSIVIVQADADECGIWIDTSKIKEFLGLKWEALNWLLREALNV